MPKATRNVEIVDETLGLWSVEYCKKGWSLRSTIIRLKDGSLAVLSPTLGLQQEVETLGAPSVLIAPNHFHHLGLRKFAERWPDAAIVASSGARPRLQKRFSDLTIGSIEPLVPLLPDGVKVIEIPGLRNGELLVRIENGEQVTWCVTDSVFNLAEHPAGMMGAICRATRTSKGVKIGRTFKILAIKEKQQYARWLREQLDSDKPSILVPAHGEVRRDSQHSETLYSLIDSELRGQLRA